MMLQRWIGMALVFFLAGCAGMPGGLEPLKVSIADVSILDLGLIEQKLGLKVRIQNPNSVDIPIDGMSYDLEMNGQPFAHGVARPQTHVPRYGEVVIQVEAVSNIGSILRQLGALQQEQKLNYRFKGELDSGRWQGARPFDMEGTISFPNLDGRQEKTPGADAL